MAGSTQRYVFIPLFADRWSEACCQLLQGSLRPAASGTVTCVRPPIHGLAFLSATGPISTLLDEWWQANVPAGTLAVLLMLHEPELDAWVGGSAAAFVVGVASGQEQALYVGSDNVTVLASREPLVVTQQAMQIHGGSACFHLDVAPAPQASAQAVIDTPFEPRVKSVAGRAAEPVHPSPTPNGAGTGWVDPFQALMSARPVMDPRPGPDEQVRQVQQLEVRHHTSHLPEQAWPPSGNGHDPAPPPLSRLRPARPKQHRRPHWSLRSLLRLAGIKLQSSAVPEELTRLALAHRQGKVVGVISRAGGVGKTAVAAAVGIVYGEAVQDSGWCAAVVDQNIGNPDQWGRLDLGPGVRTVSQIMADIEAGRQWSIPSWNNTPALAVYPESRSAADAYAPAQVERLAAQLRQLHAVSVVDLPNRLPAFTSGEAALSAGWVAAADLIAIPTTDDPTRLQGVIELLDAPLIKGDPYNGYRSVPVVVAYVRSPLRAIRESAQVVEILNEIRERAVEVVEIPKNERATLAIVRGQPITQVDPDLRAAYVDLALAVARALADD